MHAKVPLRGTNKLLTKNRKEESGSGSAQSADWQHLVSQFVQAAAQSSTSTTIVPLAGGPPTISPPSISIPSQLPPPLADVAPVAAATPQVDAQPGGHREAAQPDLQPVEAPLVGSPNVLPPHAMLKQLETVGGWGIEGEGDEATIDGEAKADSKQVLKRPRGVLLKRPSKVAKPRPAASDKMLVLGCPKCRGLTHGCANCRDPSYSGKMGPTCKPKV